jgi:hypothetical protein
MDVEANNPLEGEHGHIELYLFQMVMELVQISLD